MNTQIKAGKGYRRLAWSDTVREGDEFYDSSKSKWFTTVTPGVRASQIHTAYRRKVNKPTVETVTLWYYTVDGRIDVVSDSIGRPAPSVTAAFNRRVDVKYGKVCGPLRSIELTLDLPKK